MFRDEFDIAVCGLGLPKGDADLALATDPGVVAPLPLAIFKLGLGD